MTTSRHRGVALKRWSTLSQIAGLPSFCTLIFPRNFRLPRYESCPDSGRGLWWRTNSYADLHILLLFAR
jgi:hypothetical protein